ncbi:MAG: glycosyltransferase family 2 protein [Ignavibacteria bacterium]|jgi:hypothetical protein
MNDVQKNFLSIVIVTWNSEEDIAECLGSIYNEFYDESKLKVETIVIDNNSDDNSVAVIENFIKIFPYDVKLIKNSDNLGYTKGCNQGVKIASGNCVLLLNPDTQIRNDALSKMIEYIEKRSEVGAIAPQLYTRHKVIQYSCRRFPRYIDLFFEISRLSVIFSSSKIFARWKMRYFNHEEISEVEQPMAAALLIKADMFFNDIDTCKQIYNLGYKIIFYPDAKVYHKIGTSILKDRVRMIKAWNNDCLSYFKKNEYNPFLHILLLIGLKTSGFFRILFTKIFYR